MLEQESNPDSLELAGQQQQQQQEQEQLQQQQAAQCGAVQQDHAQPSQRLCSSSLSAHCAQEVCGSRRLLLGSVVAAGVL